MLFVDEVQQMKYSRMPGSTQASNCRLQLTRSTSHCCTCRQLQRSTTPRHCRPQLHTAAAACVPAGSPAPLTAAAPLTAGPSSFSAAAAAVWRPLRRTGDTAVDAGAACLRRLFLPGTPAAFAPASAASAAVRFLLVLPPSVSCRTTQQHAAQALATQQWREAQPTSTRWRSCTQQTVK
jgi:hypothetical protein